MQELKIGDIVEVIKQPSDKFALYDKGEWGKILSFDGPVARVLFAGFCRDKEATIASAGIIKWHLRLKAI